MLILLSPAKTLDFETSHSVTEFTLPDHLSESESLIRTLRRQSLRKLMDLMQISPDLARLNRDRYRDWTEEMTLENARQAILAFKGDVYLGLQAGTMKRNDLGFTQKHVRILSGLHGALRPLDLIQPYRLEMGTSLRTRRGKSLYEFWGDRITGALDEHLKSLQSSEVINLASKEYFAAVHPDQLESRIITPNFKEWKNGKWRFLSFFAKKARGLMTRYAVDHRIDRAEDLKAFDSEGYSFNEDLSTQDDWIFTRKPAD